MESTGVLILNLVFSLLLAALSIGGYVLTYKRTGQHWPFWIVLATGWTVLAIPYIVLLAGSSIPVAVMGGVGLCSYLLIMVSLVLIFMKLMEEMKNKEKEKE